MVGWFEIPVVDMDRAKDFYEAVFDVSISIHDLDGFVMGWFPNAPNKTGTTGSLVKHEKYIPSDTAGPLIYFSCKDISTELSRVAEAGGIVLQEKTAIASAIAVM